MILTRILPGLLVGVFACASVSLAAVHGVTLSKANEQAVERYAKRYIKDSGGSDILKGILWVESKYGKYKSGKGSYGIAQIEIPTAKYVAEKYGFKIPASNKGVRAMLMRDDRMSIKIAAAYLGMLEKRFGSLDHVIVAYNLGPTKLSKIAKGGRSVTTDYLTKVRAITKRNRRATKAASAKARRAKAERKQAKTASLPRLAPEKELNRAAHGYEVAQAATLVYETRHCEDSYRAPLTAEYPGYPRTAKDRSFGPLLRELAALLEVPFYGNAQPGASG